MLWSNAFACSAVHAFGLIKVTALRRQLAARKMTTMSRNIGALEFSEPIGRRALLCGSVAVIGMSVLGGSRGRAAAQSSSGFLDTFNWTGQLEEAGSMAESQSAYWWLNSGAYHYEQNGVASTVQIRLPQNDRWRMAYANGNSVDTDGGYHPQNLFRLVHRYTWLNYQQQCYFRISRDTLSPSSERDAWSGLLLFNRYQDGNNLYYTGVRFDGNAVVKKKQNGVYVEGATQLKKLFPGTYNRTSNPSLLPKNVWIGLRSIVTNNADGSVIVTLYVDMNGTGSWTIGGSLRDDGRFGPALRMPGHTGIRIDYMDVEFENFQVAPK